jgi:hypothetical protein
MTIDQNLNTEMITPESIQYIVKKIVHEVQPGKIILFGRRFPIDLIVRKQKEIEWNFKAKNSFYLHHIFKDGKVLYEKKNSEGQVLDTVMFSDNKINKRKVINENKKA